MTQKYKKMEELKADLIGFNGTEQYHKLTLTPMLATDGAAYLCKSAACYWLADLIASYQIGDKVKGAPFQIWTVRVEDDKTAVVKMQEDQGERVIVSQKIGYCDLPAGELKLYLIDNVLLLPDEY